eukprot:scaffold112500_cov63-Phaeocystis_antarctica.AAC.4
MLGTNRARRARRCPWPPAAAPLPGRHHQPRAAWAHRRGSVPRTRVPRARGRGARRRRVPTSRAPRGTRPAGEAVRGPPRSGTGGRLRRARSSRAGHRRPPAGFAQPAWSARLLLLAVQPCRARPRLRRPQRLWERHC